MFIVRLFIYVYQKGEPSPQWMGEAYILTYYLHPDYLQSTFDAFQKPTSQS